MDITVLVNDRTRRMLRQNIERSSIIDDINVSLSRLIVYKNVDIEQYICVFRFSVLKRETKQLLSERICFDKYINARIKKNEHFFFFFVRIF